MTIAHRSTLVVHGRLAMRESRLAAGRACQHGLQIMSFEQAAVRLAGTTRVAAPTARARTSRRVLDSGILFPLIC